MNKDVDKEENIKELVMHCVILLVFLIAVYGFLGPYLISAKNDFMAISGFALALGSPLISVWYFFKSIRPIIKELTKG